MNQKFDQLYHDYKNMLLENVLPFWLQYGFDRTHGGLYTGLDRNGALLETDKSVCFKVVPCGCMQLHTVRWRGDLNTKNCVIPWFLLSRTTVLIPLMDGCTFA